ncbi:MAG: hypothetical protein ACKO9Q_27525 [Pirellula sp.]
MPRFSNGILSARTFLSELTIEPSSFMRRKWSLRCSEEIISVGSDAVLQRQLGNIAFQPNIPTIIPGTFSAAYMYLPPYILSL